MSHASAEFPGPPKGYYWITTRDYDIDENLDRMQVRLWPLDGVGRMYYSWSYFSDRMMMRYRGEYLSIVERHLANDCLKEYERVNSG